MRSCTHACTWVCKLPAARPLTGAQTGETETLSRLSTTLPPYMPTWQAMPQPQLQCLLYLLASGPSLPRALEGKGARARGGGGGGGGGG
eukprot:9210328-Pyramimonas_sp.AAC.1